MENLNQYLDFCKKFAIKAPQEHIVKNSLGQNLRRFSALFRFSLDDFRWFHQEMVCSKGYFDVVCDHSLEFSDSITTPVNVKHWEKVEEEIFKNWPDRKMVFIISFLENGWESVYFSEHNGNDLIGEASRESPERNENFTYVVALFSSADTIIDGIVSFDQTEKKISEKEIEIRVVHNYSTLVN